MKPYYKIWIDQCEAAQGIKEQYGIKKALGYLIGEKLVNFVEAAYQDSAFDEELPKFIAEIKGRIRKNDNITSKNLFFIMKLLKYSI